MVLPTKHVIFVKCELVVVDEHNAGSWTALRLILQAHKGEWEDRYKILVRRTCSVARTDEATTLEYDSPSRRRDGGSRASRGLFQPNDHLYVLAFPDRLMILHGQRMFGPDELQHGSPPRTSRSAVHGANTRQSEQSAAVSLSPPRNRFRFDRLPPEDQYFLDKRKKERQELEVGEHASVSNYILTSLAHFPF